MWWRRRMWRWRRRMWRWRRWWRRRRRGRGRRCRQSRGSKCIAAERCRPRRRPSVVGTGMRAHACMSRDVPVVRGALSEQGQPAQRARSAKQPARQRSQQGKAAGEAASEAAAGNAKQQEEQCTDARAVIHPMVVVEVSRRSASTHPHQPGRPPFATGAHSDHRPLPGGHRGKGAIRSDGAGDEGSGTRKCRIGPTVHVAVGRDRRCWVAVVVPLGQRVTWR